MTEVSPQRSYNMSRIRSRNTTPERVVRDELWHRGYRYRLNDNRLPGKPDLVLPKYRAVIFINGCFWHGHKCQKHIPYDNNAFWSKKIQYNKSHDNIVNKLFQSRGWTVVRIWECELKRKNRQMLERKIRVLMF